MLTTSVDKVYLNFGGGAMALELGFYLQQEQRLQLAMTPELRQSIQLLQYSASELEEYIQEQMLENPLIDWKQDEEPEETYFSSYPIRKRFHKKKDPTDFYEKVSNPTLSSYLEEQLRELVMTKIQKKVCTYMIQSLDERGFLDLHAIEECKRFQVEVDVWNHCLTIVQSLEPAGVAANNIQECLWIQLCRRGATELAKDLVKNHLVDLAEKRFSALATKYGVTQDQIIDALEEIKCCNPRPVANFTTESIVYVEPDVKVYWEGESVSVELNERLVPQLEIKTEWMEERLLNADEKSKELVRSWIQRGIWLSKAIEQRKKTILSVTNFLAEYQKDFFIYGEKYLRPLTLREVASEIGVHESTVSRVTQNKYMETNQGLFPFRFFFPHRFISSDGVDLTSARVKDMIQKLITKEESNSPYSDQILANFLVQMGIRISRRTVAKYREELGIPSSAKRRKNYK